MALLGFAALGVLLAGFGAAMSGLMLVTVARRSARRRADRRAT